jgi:hypothetical protein
LVASEALQAALPSFFGIGYFSYPPGGLGVFENQDAAVVQLDFGCLPCLAYFFATFFAKATKVRKATKHKLVEAVRVGIRWIPGTIEPVEIGFVVGDPFLDGALGRFAALATRPRILLEYTPQVAARLLALGRQMQEGGSDEIGSLEISKLRLVL